MKFTATASQILIQERAAMRYAAAVQEIVDDMGLPQFMDEIGPLTPEQAAEFHRRVEQIKLD